MSVPSLLSSRCRVETALTTASLPRPRSRRARASASYFGTTTRTVAVYATVNDPQWRLARDSTRTTSNDDKRRQGRS